MVAEFDVIFDPKGLIYAIAIPVAEDPWVPAGWLKNATMGSISANFTINPEGIQ